MLGVLQSDFNPSLRFAIPEEDQTANTRRSKASGLVSACRLRCLSKQAFCNFAWLPTVELESPEPDTVIQIQPLSSGD